jgi:hypothetical protein
MCNNSLMVRWPKLSRFFVIVQLRCVTLDTTTIQVGHLGVTGYGTFGHYWPCGCNVAVPLAIVGPDSSSPSITIADNNSSMLRHEFDRMLEFLRVGMWPLITLPMIRWLKLSRFFWVMTRRHDMERLPVGGTYHKRHTRHGTIWGGINITCYIALISLSCNGAQT